MNVAIPDAIHICPGCDAGCVGAEYCSSCAGLQREIAEHHAERLAKLCETLPREAGRMPEDRGKGRWLYLAVLVVGAVVVKLCAALWVPGAGSTEPAVLRKLVRNGAWVILLAMWLAMVVDMISKGRGW